jgi:hypothetical protein
MSKVTSMNLIYPQYWTITNLTIKGSLLTRMDYAFAAASKSISALHVMGMPS